MSFVIVILLNKCVAYDNLRQDGIKMINKDVSLVMIVINVCIYK